MIHKVTKTYYSLSCDRCGCAFENDETDDVLFEDFTDMSEVIDYGKRVEGGMCSLAEWLRDFKEAKGTYYYNKDDMAPFEYLFEHWDEYK